MKFEIKEFTSKIKTRNKIVDFILNYTVIPIIGIFMLLVVIPIVLIINFFSKKKKDEKIKSQFEKEFENEKIIIERRSIDEVDYPDYLNFDEVYDDYLHVFKSSPELDLFKDRYFDFNFFETENEIFLISYNKENQGMSLWFINKNTLEFEKIRDIKSSFWTFQKEDSKIILSTQTEKEEIKLEINL